MESEESHRSPASVKDVVLSMLRALQRSHLDLLAPLHINVTGRIRHRGPAFMQLNLQHLLSELGVLKTKKQREV